MVNTYDARRIDLQSCGQISAGLTAPSQHVLRGASLFPTISHLSRKTDKWRGLEIKAFRNSSASTPTSTTSPEFELEPIPTIPQTSLIRQPCSPAVYSPAALFKTADRAAKHPWPGVLDDFTIYARGPLGLPARSKALLTHYLLPVRNTVKEVDFITGGSETLCWILMASREQKTLEPPERTWLVARLLNVCKATSPAFRLRLQAGLLGMLTLCEPALDLAWHPACFAESMLAGLDEARSGPISGVTSSDGTQKESGSG